ncbi:MAG: type II restriction endonuclease [Alphaproteobacteria bacterium]|nr:type II restriction endonuclease [Alphaproteobacteria bacterium]
MKYSPIFDQQIKCKNPDEVFAHLIANLKPTIKSWDYFVNWAKVIKNYHDVETSLNLLNTLIGKDDVEAAAANLLKEYPKVISIVPDLLAYREKKLNLLTDIKNFTYENYDFSKPMDVPKAVRFLKETGFLKLVSNKTLKSIPDYFIGLEVGLDTNGRKNRSGTTMENLIEFFVKDICARNEYEYMTQATADKIHKRWSKKITVHKSSKRVDFAINTPNKLFLIETNFYGGGGSKLKSTAGEYTDAYKQWTKDGHQFIWITDGLGWGKTQLPLRDTFDTTDYILNIDMVQKGVLEGVLK